MKTLRSVAGIGLSCVLLACGGDDGGGADTDDAGTGSESDDPTVAPSASTSSGGASQSGADDEGPGSSGADSGSETAADDTGDPTGGEDTPVLPAPDGPCPEFVSGDLDFRPAETGPRRARVFYDPAAGGGGPLVFWFHGTGGDPAGSENAISAEDRDAIVAAGGMVVMPWADPASGQFPWFLVTAQQEDDLHLMDEIVGCAAEGPGIDARRIHAAGFSAGALHVSQAALRRASYVASTVAVSGGLYSATTPSDAPDQVISAWIMHGGPTDDAGGLNFQLASETFASVVEARGGYALLCNHAMGHSYVSEREFAWEFFLAHPFGTDPSPFETDGVPSWVPSWCDR